MRLSQLQRKTGETDVSVDLNLDGSGMSNIATGCGFLDHMLILFAKHGRFDLNIKCTGDTEIDDHHTVEDIGIVLGQAFAQALGECKGIKRFGQRLLPMDEALVLAAVDISGRSFFVYDLPMSTEKVGTFDTELVEEFFIAFAGNAKITLHIKGLSGKNSHHIIEGAFKAVARALSEAVAIDEKFKDDIPSTKGVLS